MSSTNTSSSNTNGSSSGGTSLRPSPSSSSSSGTASKSATGSNSNSSGTKVLDSYGNDMSTPNASGYYHGAISSDSNVSYQHWAPTSAIIGLGNIDFGAESTHYVGNIQNYASQIYNLGAMSANMNIQHMPSGWTQGAATQFNILNREELQFASSLVNQLTLNPPVAPPPVVSSVLSGLSPISSQINASNSIPDNRVNNPVADAQRQGSFNIEKALLGKAQLSKGYDIASKFWNIGQSSEATELLGESAIESAESGLAGALESVGLEEAGAGILAAGAEAIGGAAVVGTAIVGAEILAGAAVVGLGIYETYKAFGGKEDFSSITEKASSGIHAAVKWGEEITHWFP